MRAMLVLFLFASAVHAQTFPNKPVKIVVPYPPGGGNDIMARLIQAKMTADWNQPVVVENKPGAAGNLGAGEMAAFVRSEVVKWGRTIREASIKAD